MAEASRSAQVIRDEITQAKARYQFLRATDRYRYQTWNIININSKYQDTTPLFILLSLVKREGRGVVVIVSVMQILVSYNLWGEPTYLLHLSFCT